MADGGDWKDVPEGTEYTPEQAARKFLSLTFEEQVERMERFHESAQMAYACVTLNHEGAHIFATQHTCRPDRFQEGWEQGWADAFAEMEKRMEALGK